MCVLYCCISFYFYIALFVVKMSAELEIILKNSYLVTSLLYVTFDIVIISVSFYLILVMISVCLLGFSFLYFVV